MTWNIDRRAFLYGVPAAAAWVSAGRAAAQSSAEDRPGAKLSPWRPGRLDIHHIATGRGDATLIVGPDGTTLLIDAGATASDLHLSAPPRPNAGRRPGEWVARYAGRRLIETNGKGLDYVVVSHLHPDHLGDVTPDCPVSPHGDYRLTGIMDVAELLPIGVLLDRCFPDYDYPYPTVNGAFVSNYRAFVQARRRAGGQVERFAPGRSDQIRLRHPAAYPGFAIRNISANGEVWSGTGDQTRQIFPPLATLARGDYPDENMYSISMKLSFGRFDYFAAGDLSSNTFDGDMPWRDIGGAAARVVGPVEVAAAPHHGLSDAIGAPLVRSLRPQAWIVPTWHITHPTLDALGRMFSERLYPGPREVFATEVMPETALIDARLLRRAKSIGGHVVVRVEDGSTDFRIVVTDNKNENDTVLGVYGPFPST